MFKSVSAPFCLVLEDNCKSLQYPVISSVLCDPDPLSEMLTDPAVNFIFLPCYVVWVMQESEEVSFYTLAVFCLRSGVNIAFIYC